MPRVWQFFLTKGLSCFSVEDNKKVLRVERAQCWAVSENKYQVLILQFKDLRVGQRKGTLYWLIQENLIENSVQDHLPYIP